MKRSYKIYDKEMLAMIRELENQRYLLEGTKFKYKTWTDHQNLKYFIKAQKLDRRQVLQTLYLLIFSFILKYVLETKIGKADRLGRRLE